jgi:hypothetical protein
MSFAAEPYRERLEKRVPQQVLGGRLTAPPPQGILARTTAKSVPQPHFPRGIALLIKLGPTFLRRKGRGYCLDDALKHAAFVLVLQSTMLAVLSCLALLLLVAGRPTSVRRAETGVPICGTGPPQDFHDCNVGQPGLARQRLIIDRSLCLVWAVALQALSNSYALTRPSRPPSAAPVGSRRLPTTGAICPSAKAG